MAETIHVTRLTWWDYRGRGEAEHDGVTVALRSRPPVLRHIRAITELCYVPGAGARYVQEQGQQRRDLQPGESTELLLWLQHLATITRDAASQPRAS